MRIRNSQTKRRVGDDKLCRNSAVSFACAFEYGITEADKEKKPNRDR